MASLSVSGSIGSSALTSVRVRGKKKRKIQDESSAQATISPNLRIPGYSKGPHSGNIHSSLLIPPPRGKKNTGSVMASNKYHVLSPFERLPTELIQEIFLISPNLNLPFASPHLASVLSSVQFKHLLLLRVFSSEATAQDDVELKSALLRRKWLTYSFFRNCREAFLTRAAVKYVRKAAGASSRASIDMTIIELKNVLEDHFRKREGKMFISTTTTLITFLYAWESFMKNKNLLHNPSYFKGLLPFLSFPNASACQIPEKLLHGPWTQEKGDFLTLLLDQGGSIDWVNSTSGEIATRGLEDAIGKGVLPAVLALVRRNYLDNYKTEHRIIRAYEWLQSTNPDYTDTNAVQESPKVPQKWKTLNRDLSVHKAVGVTTTTAHLKLAINIHNDPTAGIIYALTRSKWTEIDPDDPEITNWAYAHLAKIEDGAGEAPLVVQERSSEDGQLVDRWTVTGQTVFADLEHIRCNIRARERKQARKQAREQARWEHGMNRGIMSARSQRYLNSILDEYGYGS